MRRLLLPTGCALLGVWLAFSQAPDSAAAKKGDSKKKGLPLKPDRKLEFTTDEATWMSVDLSPDGKTILFDLLGDIYALDSAGGTARNILPGPGYDVQPRFSPDGKTIAFISDRDGADNLYLADANGANVRQLTREQQGSYISPAWSEDGAYVLASMRTSRAGGATHEIWMYHHKGGPGIQVTKSALPPPRRPAFPGARPQGRRDLGVVASPDGKYFYFARRMGEFNYDMTLPAWQLVRRDRITGDEDTITSEIGSAFRPALTPDGKSLLYFTRADNETELRIRDLATGEERTIKRPVQRDDQESRALLDVYPGYAVTPDGKDVLLSYGGKIHRVSIATGEDKLIPFAAAVSLDLHTRLHFPARVEDSATLRARLIQQPALSPDGARIAFSVLTRLYIANRDGSQPRRLANVTDRAYHPVWSPDGQSLAYTTWSRDGGHIFKIQATGNAQPVRLTDIPAFYNEPAWSPDGQKIVALRAARKVRLQAGGFGFRGAMDLISVPAAGGPTTTIIPARGLGKPHFTRDASRIYVYSPGGLISLRWDGTDRRTHLRVVTRSDGPEPGAADDVRLHPDGKLAIAIARRQAWVLTVPPSTGDTLTVNLDSPSVPVKRLTDLGADSISWTPDGKAVFFSLGSTVFHQPLDRITLEAPTSARGEAPPTPAADAPKPAPTFTETPIHVDVPRPKPTGAVVFRNTRLITMKGDEVIANGDLVIDGNRIAAAGPRGKVTLPANAKTYDLKGATIMPGIVDVHAHWIEIKRGTLDLDGWPYMANLAYGVTTGRDPQTGTNDSFAYQDLIDAGEILGPRAYSTGPGVFSELNFQSLEEAKNTVARYQRYYRTHTLKSYAIGNRRQRQWMIEAARELKMMPTTEGSLDLKLDLTHAVDGFSGNEHALPIVPLYKDVIQLYSQSGIFYTPTLLVAYGGPAGEHFFYETTEVYGDRKLQRFIAPNELQQKAARRPWFRKEEHVFPRLAAEAAKVVRAGGRVQIGGHGQLQGIQCHWEMWALASGGMTNHEVLRAATLHGAEAIGFAQDLGSLEPGKLADLIVLNQNPLTDIRNTAAIRYVMKNGELFVGDTLEQLWPQAKPAPTLWWHTK